MMPANYKSLITYKICISTAEKIMESIGLPCKLYIGTKEGRIFFIFQN